MYIMHARLRVELVKKPSVERGKKEKKEKTFAIYSAYIYIYTHMYKARFPIGDLADGKIFVTSEL